MQLLALLTSGAAAFSISQGISQHRRYFGFGAQSISACRRSSRSPAAALICNMSKEIYDIPNSGWASPEWNWGYAVGTGHDCALICRQKYATRDERRALVESLLLDDADSTVPFEEVKLILGLAWQRGRWDGSDGGPDGYGQVLSEMARAEKYEVGSDEECSKRLINDMSERFHLLEPTKEDLEGMKSLSSESDYDIARRKCAGLVLKEMRFIENGL